MRCCSSVATSGVDANVVGSYTLTYTATDASHNTGSATRVVTVSDSTPPVINSDDGGDQTIECHSAFADAGATAD